MDNTFIAQLYGKSLNYTDIPNHLYKDYNVKKGLRNEDNTGVLIGLTKVSDVVGYEYDENGKKCDTEGKLYFRGINIKDIIENHTKGGFIFEEVCFLLLFGYLPSRKELDNFIKTLQSKYKLPRDFLEMNLLRMPGKNLMNKLQLAVLSLYNYDKDPDNTDSYQILLKGINLMAKIPSIACYAYQSKRHHFHNESLIIHYPDREASIAENILYLLRPDKKFIKEEANLLDVLMVLHADHGGGNNSTFTNVVVSSTATDLYSSVAASIGSLKGPRHGGANIRVCGMMDAIVEEVGWEADDKTLENLVRRIVKKDFYDGTGLVYGFGHAVYTLSDPRAEILRTYCGKLAEKKDNMTQFNFYLRLEAAVKKVLMEEKGLVAAPNVDYYSGFAYSMLNIPRELYTPLFVIARVVGWLAHNIENKLYDGRIMRPATKCVSEITPYVKMEER